MRIEIAGSQVTDSVVEVLENLQTQPQLVKSYLRTLDVVTRIIILDITADEDKDTETLNHIRALQMIRRDISTLADPPDADDPANDVPTASF